MTNPMYWQTALAAWITAGRSDSDVQAVLGDPAAFYFAGERDFAVPSAEVEIIGNVETELWEVLLVQLTVWVRTIADLVALENALRKAYHHDVFTAIGGVDMWSQLVDGRTLTGKRQETYNRSLDFRLTFLRGRWAA